MLFETFLPAITSIVKMNANCGEVVTTIPSIPYIYTWNGGFKSMSVGTPSTTYNIGALITSGNIVTPTPISNEHLIMRMPILIKSFDIDKTISIRISLLNSLGEDVYTIYTLSVDEINALKGKWNELIYKIQIPEGFELLSYSISLYATEVVDGVIEFGVPDITNADISPNTSRDELIEICSRIHQRTYQVLEESENNTFETKNVVSNVILNDYMTILNENVVLNDKYVVTTSLDMLDKIDISRFNSLLKDKVVSMEFFETNFNKCIEVYLNRNKIPNKLIELIVSDKLTQFIIPRYICDYVTDENPINMVVYNTDSGAKTIYGKNNDNAISLIENIGMDVFDSLIESPFYPLNQTANKFGLISNTKIRAGMIKDLTVDYNRLLNNINRMSINTLHVAIPFNVSAGNIVSVDDSDLYMTIKIINTIRQINPNITITNFIRFVTLNGNPITLSPETVTGFFDSYKIAVKQTLNIVTVPYNITSFSVFYNAGSIESYQSEWGDVVDYIKSMYPYNVNAIFDLWSSDNFSAMLTNTLIPKLNMVHVRCHNLELSTLDNPSISDIMTAFTSGIGGRNIINELEQIATTFTKNISLVDISCASRNKALTNTSVDSASSIENMSIQPNFIEALSNIISAKSWISGISYRNFMTNDWIKTHGTEIARIDGDMGLYLMPENGMGYNGSTNFIKHFKNSHDIISEFEIAIPSTLNDGISTLKFGLLYDDYSAMDVLTFDHVSSTTNTITFNSIRSNTTRVYNDTLLLKCRIEILGLVYKVYINNELVVDSTCSSSNLYAVNVRHVAMHTNKLSKLNIRFVTIYDYSLFKNSAFSYDTSKLIGYYNLKESPVHKIGDMAFSVTKTALSDIIYSSDLVYNEYISGKGTSEIIDSKAVFDFGLSTKIPLSKYNMKLFDSNGLLLINKTIPGLDLTTVPHVEIIDIMKNRFSVNANEILTGFVMHDDNISNYEYNDMVTEYSKVEDYMAQLRANTLPDVIKNFSKLQMEIDLDDFKNLDISMEDKYRQELIKAVQYSGKLFEEYIDTNIDKNGMIIKVKDIDINLTTRMNSNLDVSLPKNQVTFTTEHIAIKFSNPNQYPFNVYYNGLILNSATHLMVREGYECICFVDKSKLESYNRDTDIVEIELIPFNTTQYIGGEFTLSDNKYVSITDPNLKGTNILLFEKKSDKFIFIDTNKYLINKINDKFTLAGVSNMTGTYKMASNEFYVKKEAIQSPTVFDTEIPELNYTNWSVEYMRMYLNGRYIPRANIKRMNIIEDSAIVNTKVASNINAGSIDKELSIEYFPYATKEILEIDSVDPSGLIKIDLTKLQFPLSMKFYNFYLNGRKLTTLNELTISESYIQLKDVKSLRHFVVVEKYNINDLLSEVFAKAAYPFDTYLKSIVDIQKYIGTIYPILEQETEYLNQFTRAAMLSFFLYENHLKNNDVTTEISMNQDILINYAELIGEDGIISLDARDEQIQPMPL